MKRLIIVCTLSIVVGLCGCTRLLELSHAQDDLAVLSQQPIDADAVALGISLHQKRLGISGPVLEPVQTAIFVRLEDKEGSLKQDRIIFSTRFSGGFVYLLNAQPGRYAVVAVYFNRGGVSLLPKTLIQQTVTAIDPGTVGYLGDYELKRDSIGSEGEGDDVQEYYSQRFWGEPLKPGRSVAQFLSGKRDNERKKQYLRHTDEALLEGRGGIWSTWIQQQLQLQP